MVKREFQTLSVSSLKSRLELKTARSCGFKAKGNVVSAEEQMGTSMSLSAFSRQKSLYAERGRSTLGSKASQLTRSLLHLEEKLTCRRSMVSRRRMSQLEQRMETRSSSKVKAYEQMGLLVTSSRLQTSSLSAISQKQKSKRLRRLKQSSACLHSKLRLTSLPKLSTSLSRSEKHNTLWLSGFSRQTGTLGWKQS